MSTTGRFFHTATSKGGDEERNISGWCFLIFLPIPPPAFPPLLPILIETLSLSAMGPELVSRKANI